MTALPPVAPAAAAAALDLLPARLRKRLDAAVAKLAGRPVDSGPSAVRIQVDDENTVTLTLTGAIVASADDVSCSCLLAPACLHRAAVLAAAPVAEDSAVPAADVAEDGADGADGVGVSAAPAPGAGPSATGAAPPRAEAGAAGLRAEATTPTASPTDVAPPATPPTDPGPPATPTPDVASLTPAALDAAHALWAAGVAIVGAGISGTGAVRRTALLHAAHSARLAGLHRAAATALRVARRLAEARDAEPGFRLAELAADLAALLDDVRPAVDPGSTDQDRVALMSPARRSYRSAQPLRLYGLFTEPVVTASGYAGATAYAVGVDGARYTVADVAPGGPERAIRAAGSAVPGGCALPLRELGAGAGLIMTAAAVSADGRIGGGAQVRSVRATGTDWSGPPLAALWERPLPEQLAAVFDWLDQPVESRRAADGLLFLDGIVVSADGAPALALNGDGPLVRLYAPDERAELPYADNLRLLAGSPGLPVRLIGRLVPDRPGGVTALAACWPDHDGKPFRVDLGLQRLSRSSIPRRGVVDPGAPPPPIPELPLELDLLNRAVARTVAGGRAVTAAAADDRLPLRLRTVGLTTGARCAERLAAAANDRRTDALGRLLPGDPDAFARAWLAAAVYTSAANRSLIAASWGLG